MTRILLIPGALAAIGVLAACNQSDSAPSKAAPKPAGTATGAAGSAAGSTTAGSAAAGSATAGAPAAATAGGATAAAPTSECTPLPFAQSTPVPEASGAAWLTIDGTRVLVVVSDSGNRGAYGVIDPESGKTLEEGRLPLGDAGEDIEGAAGRGELVYGVTSSGWIRAWKRTAHGFELAQAAYPLGPVTLPDRNSKLRPPEGDGMVCGAKATNCGRDYEGLCLAATPPKGDAACVGYVASRADGHLYCLEEHAGKLVAMHDRAIAIGKPGTLADCAFSDDDRLFVGANLFGTDEVVRVDGWADPATATVVRLAPIGVGFPEVIAARGDTIWRMSDTGGAPSLMARYRCPR